jgi:hypothetical protein
MYEASMMIQRIALYATMGMLLNALGHTWDSWGFWCVLAMFWGSELITRMEQHQQSYVEGILMYIQLPVDKQQELVTAIKQVESKYND